MKQMVMEVILVLFIFGILIGALVVLSGCAYSPEQYAKWDNTQSPAEEMREVGRTLIRADRYRRW